MLRVGEQGNGVYQAKRDLILKWIFDYPLRNHEWTGYYEDVGSETHSINQQSPIETARFLLRRPELDADYKSHVSALLAWTKDHFGQTKRYGATSVKEQTCCFFEMSSHTTRYASVVANQRKIDKPTGSAFLRRNAGLGAIAYSESRSLTGYAVSLVR